MAKCKTIYHIHLQTSIAACFLSCCVFVHVFVDTTTTLFYHTYSLLSLMPLFFVFCFALFFLFSFALRFCFVFFLHQPRLSPVVVTAWVAGAVLAWPGGPVLLFCLLKESQLLVVFLRAESCFSMAVAAVSGVFIVIAGTFRCLPPLIYSEKRVFTSHLVHHCYWFLYRLQLG